MTSNHKITGPPSQGSLVSLLALWDDLLVEGQSPDTGILEQLPCSIRERLSADLDILQKLRKMAVPGTIGRYTLLRELGSGGFGSVHLAFDASLERQVALKLPHAQYLASPLSRLNFIFEARAAARLQHPNVLPIYEVGEAGPLCFTASEYCSAGNLMEWMARNSSIHWRDAAALVATLADAVEHAHSRGVLHRDLKPANVLLEPIGQTAGKTLGEYIPRLADFGLAKLLESPDEIESISILLGTPGYMAPEYFDGKNNNGISVDIYGLGTILYECLTGVPPYKAITPLATMELARSHEPVPLRQLLPKLPLDIASICQKCLSRDPAERYCSAGDLRDELQRCLRGEAIQARQIGPIERIAKWSCRRPATAVSLVALTLFLATSISAGIWHYVQMDHALALAEKGQLDANTAKIQAQLESRYAEANLGRIHKALEVMTNGVSEVLIFLPNGSIACRPILEKVIHIYSEIASSHEDSLLAKCNAIDAKMRLCSLLRMTGKTSESYSHLTSSNDELTKLIQQYPESRRVLISLATSHLALGYWFLHQRKFEQAQHNLVLAESQLKQLQSIQDNDDVSMMLSSCLEHQGLVAMRRAQYQVAEQFFVKVEQMRSAPRKVEANLHAHALALINLGISRAGQKREQEAEKAFKAAEDELTKLLETNPHTMAIRSALGQVGSYLSRLDINKDRQIDLLLPSLVHLRQLAYPVAATVYRRELARSLMRLCDHQNKANLFDQSLASASEALQLTKNIYQSDPKDATSQVDLLLALSLTSAASSKANKPEDAETLFAEAFKLGETLLQNRKDDFSVQYIMSSLLSGYAMHLTKLNRVNAAEAYIERSLRMAHKLLEQRPNNPDCNKLLQEVEKVKLTMITREMF